MNANEQIKLGVFFITGFLLIISNGNPTGVPLTARETELSKDGVTEERNFAWFQADVTVCSRCLGKVPVWTIKGSNQACTTACKNLKWHPNITGGICIKTKGQVYNRCHCEYKPMTDANETTIPEAKREITQVLLSKAANQIGRDLRYLLLNIEKELANALQTQVADALETQLNNHKHEISVKTNEIQSLENQLQNARTIITNLESNINLNSEAEVARQKVVTEQLSKLQQDISRMTKEHETNINKRVEEHENEKMKMREEITNLAADNNKIRGELAILNGQLSGIMVQNNPLKEPEPETTQPENNRWSDMIGSLGLRTARTTAASIGLPITYPAMPNLPNSKEMKDMAARAAKEFKKDDGTSFGMEGMPGTHQTGNSA